MGMHEYVEILKRHVAENLPNYGSDANSILEIQGRYRIIDHRPVAILELM